MNKRIFLLALILPMFFACKTKKYSRNNKEIEKAANKANPNIPSYTTLNYIETFKTVAIEEMNTYGIPASITLAQGIIESGSGNSSLAKYANNHFGIKCTSEWKGKAYYKDDDNSNDCFRVYKDARESYKDHSAVSQRENATAFCSNWTRTTIKTGQDGLKASWVCHQSKISGDLLIRV
jgi:flagellum-specific peptidoglycan hydrolase FlgJ